MVDEIVGTTTFSIEELPPSKWETKTLVFNSKGYSLLSKIYTSLLLL